MCNKCSSASALNFLFAHRVKSPSQDLSTVIKIFFFFFVSRSIINYLIIWSLSALISESISSKSLNYNSTKLASTCLCFIIVLHKHYFCLVSTLCPKCGMNFSSMLCIYFRTLAKILCIACLTFTYWLFAVSMRIP